jgi:predicted 3-demethylubiquinone-9 3-methyltransferase (glyoxalase superfamily)
MSSISPCLWFDGKAEQAARYYVSLLPNSSIDAILPYTIETPGGAPGDVMAVEFTLAGQAYLALNGGPAFHFTPAMSLFVSCEDQAEVDRLWAALSEGGSPQRCGWITDRYGVSWQVAPAELAAMMKDGDAERARRVMQAMMQMVKLDLDELRRAYEGQVLT